MFRGDRNFEYDNHTIENYSLQWSHITHKNTISDNKYGGLVRGGTQNQSAPHADSRWMTMDADGNLIETSDGGVYKLTNPLNNTGDWYSLNGNLCVLEIHSLAYERNSDRVHIGTQDNGTILGDANSSLTLQGGDGGDCHVVYTLGQEVRYTQSAQNGRSFKVFTEIPFHSSIYLTWIHGHCDFVPVTAINKQTQNHLAVSIIEKDTDYNINTQGIYTVSLDNWSTANNPFLRMSSISDSNLRYWEINHIKYGHKNDTFALYVATDDRIFWDTENHGKGSYNLAPMMLDGPDDKRLYCIDVHPNNENEVMVVSGGYDWYWGEINSTDTLDNDLFLFDISTSSFTKIDLPYNHTRVCLYVEREDGTIVLVVGHSKGVAYYQNNTWHDLYPDSFPNILVTDMVYDEVVRKLVVSTMGRGAFSLDF